MKKKIICVVFIILVIIAAVCLVNKLSSDKINYEVVEIQKYNYFKYKDNEKYGIIDKNGKIIINAEYNEIKIPNPEFDIFICYKEQKNVVLNEKNEKMFENYEEIDPIEIKNVVSVLPFEKNILKYKKDGKWGLINFSGKEITKNIYTSIENLQASEGKFLVSNNEKYGVINVNGKTLVELEYDSIRSDEYFSDETGYVKAGFITSIKTSEGYRYGYRNYEGRKILKEEYNDMVRIQDKEKVYLIVSKDGRYGLYQDSKKIINTEYQEMEYCDDDTLIIRKNKNYGVAKIDGKIIIDLKYSRLQKKGIYLYAENSNERKVYDKNGNIVDINYEKIVYNTDNPEYRVFILTNNEIIYYGIENSKGKELVPPRYGYLEYAYKNYFIAKNDKGNLGIINSNGKVLLDFKYETLQKLKGKNIIQAIENDSKNTEIYSSELDKVCTIKNAKINNENGYMTIYNDKEIIYMDNNGKILKNDSEELNNMKLKNFPDKIGEYKKIQESLDKIYYIKEEKK